MKLYIANTSKQRHTFAFRVLETGRLRQIPIEHGSQMLVLDNASSDQVEAVIQHHAVYGLINASNIDQSTAFVGLCYSIDKPVISSVIEKAIRDNDNHLSRGAHQTRQASLAALDKTLSENGSGYAGEMEFTVEQAKSREDSDDAATVNETIVTEKTGAKKK